MPAQGTSTLTRFVLGFSGLSVNRLSLYAFALVAPKADSDRRGIALFFGGLAVVVLALAIAGVVQREKEAPGGEGAPSAPTLPESSLLGPRDPNEPRATGEFELHGKRSGHDKSFYVLGLVKNTSPYAVDKPTVVVTLTDGAGTVIARHEGYAERDRLEPGEASPVKVLVTDPPAHQALEFEVVVRRSLFDPGKVEDLEVELDGPPRQNFNTWEVTGTVKNRSKVGARMTRVELVARNSAGKIIGVESAFVEDQLLEPGQTSRFRSNVMLDESPAKVEPSAFARPAR